MKTHKPNKPGKAHTTYKPKARTLSLKSAAWRRLRAQVLAEQPLCPLCAARGWTVPAVDVDHIDNDGDNNARTNLVGLCHSCHALKTAQDMGKKVNWGCDLNGWPLDPGHPWHEKSPATEPPQTAAPVTRTPPQLGGTDG
jgi:5-methylcytosine-specific restriction protein A